MRKRAVYLNHARERAVVPVVSDAVILSVGVAEGRAIPVLILDTTLRSDIDDLIRVHEQLGPGDATTSWASAGTFDRRHLRLVIEFQKPQRCVIILEFDIARQGGVVDQVVQSELLYLQGGRPGDRLKNTMERPRIVVEVPSEGFRLRWEQLWRREIARDFKKRGMARAAIAEAVDGLVSEWRELWSKRIVSE
jgi:hypothetical protein